MHRMSYALYNLHAIQFYLYIRMLSLIADVRKRSGLIHARGISFVFTISTRRWCD